MKRASFPLLTILVALAGLCLASPAPAQEAWPSKPVRMIMPFPPGSGTDALARAQQRTHSAHTIQPVLKFSYPATPPEISYLTVLPQWSHKLLTALHTAQPQNSRPLVRQYG